MASKEITGLTLADEFKPGDLLLMRNSVTDTDEKLQAGDVVNLNTGTAPGDVPTNADLGEAAFLDAGTAPGDVATNQTLADRDFVRKFEDEATLFANFALNKLRLYDSAENSYTDKTYEQVFARTRASTVRVYTPTGTLAEVPVDKKAMNFDPETGAPLGDLIQDASTNDITQSYDLTVAAWEKRGTTAALEAATLVEGKQQSVLTEDTSDGVHDARFDRTVDATSEYLYAIVDGSGAGSRGIELIFDVATAAGNSNGIFVDPITLDFKKRFADDNINDIRVFRLLNGSIFIGGRFTGLNVGEVAAAVVGLMEDYASANRSYIGDGTSAITVQHVQAEAKDVPSSPIITEGTALTRAADVPSRTLGSEFTNQRGTLIVRGVRRAPFTLRGAVGFNDGTTNNRIVIFVDRSASATTNEPLFQIISENIPSPSPSIVGNVIPPGSEYALALSWKEGTLSAAQDGVALEDVAFTGTLPVVTQLGGESNAVDPMGEYADIFYLAKYLTAAELATLTTL